MQPWKSSATHTEAAIFPILTQVNASCLSAFCNDVADLNEATRMKLLTPLFAMSFEEGRRLAISQLNRSACILQAEVDVPPSAYARGIVDFAAVVTDKYHRRNLLSCLIEGKRSSLADGLAQLYMTIDCTDRKFHSLHYRTGDLYGIVTTVSEWCFVRYTPAKRAAGYPLAVTMATMQISLQQFTTSSTELRDLWRCLCHFMKEGLLLLDHCLAQHSTALAILSAEVKQRQAGRFPVPPPPVASVPDAGPAGRDEDSIGSKRSLVSDDGSDKRTHI